MAALPDTGAVPALDAEDQGLPGPMVPPNPQETLDALLNAVKVAAQIGSGAEDTREFAESSKAALAFAQAWAILHPQLDPSGMPLDHHIQMEQERGQNALALELARGDNAVKVAEVSARAPTPVKSLKVQRDTTGRISGAISGG
jgi:N-acetyl-beta-hexosaminidase